MAFGEDRDARDPVRLESMQMDVQQSCPRRFGAAALLTKMSMPPSSSQACRTSWLMHVVSARSATHICEAGELRRQSASTAASRSDRRATRPTTAP